MDIKKLLKELKSRGALHDSDEVSCEKLEGAKPVYYDGMPDFLSPEMRNALKATGINKLYQHQVDAIAASLENDVVLESPTASGKTLAFTVPMMEAIKYGDTALMVYPMNAVAFDQMRQVEALGNELDIVCYPYYKGVPEEIKSKVKQGAGDVLLTNPWYLHLSFLQWQNIWKKNDFLEKLRFIVLDESHQYRGYFGGHMSQIVRRLLATLERLGSSPRIFMATATCQNPEEHARDLTGRKNFQLISAKTAGRSPRHYISVNHQIDDGREFLREFRSRIVNAAIACASLGHSVLIFCPFVFFAKDACAEAQKKMAAAGLDSGKVVAYYADLPVDKKRFLLERIKSGDILAVFCTNALELGIDVGRLDGIILAGFPDNIASARQRIGRAGRSWNKDAFVLYYPMNNPLDKFFAANFQTFLGKPLDNIVIDPNNEEIIKRHKPFWEYEAKGGRFKPNYNLDIAGSIDGFDLVADGKSIGSISAQRAFREAYIGAVLIHDGQKYRVKTREESKTEQRIILAKEKADIRTEPLFNYPAIVNITVFDSQSYDSEVAGFSLCAHFGKLTIGEQFNGYKEVCEKSGKVLDKSHTSEAKYHNNRYMFAADLSGVPDADGIGVRTLEQFIRIGAMFVVSADRHDTSTSSDKKTLYLYENYPGGIGVARQVFANWQEIMKKGADIARNCSCAIGCPNCIVPPRKSEKMDKNIGIRLADYILEKVADCG